MDSLISYYNYIKVTSIIVFILFDHFTLIVCLQVNRLFGCSNFILKCVLECATMDN